MTTTKTVPNGTAPKADASLSKAEAAGREDGLLVCPETMKAVTRQRTLGRLEALGLIAADDDGEPRLTPGGYRAIGLRPPRRKKTDRASAAVSGGAQASPQEIAGVAAPAPSTAAAVPSAASRAGTKRALLAAMLARRDGASLDELMAATGWLPHTTRAALSRIRAAGQDLAKSRRPDGRTAYRVEPCRGVAA